MIKFTIPVRTSNPLNGSQGRTRGAVLAKAAQRKKQRQTARYATMAACGEQGPNPWLWCKAVTMTRVSAGVLDGDGCQAALKSVRDGVADALGIDDGSTDVTWCYLQRKCKRGSYCVEVSIS